MRQMSTIDWIAVVLVVVGALNWGLVGLFGYDLVANLFGGSDGTIARVIYVLVGLAGVWMIFAASKNSNPQV